MATFLVKTYYLLLTTTVVGACEDQLAHAAQRQVDLLVRVRVRLRVRVRVRVRVGVGVRVRARVRAPDRSPG